MPQPDTVASSVTQPSNEPATQPALSKDCSIGQAADRGEEAAPVRPRLKESQADERAPVLTLA